MIPQNYKFLESHEWVKIEENKAIIGISDHAQDALGDITFVEHPEIGTSLNKGDECAVIESVKAASDIYMPISGTVCEINSNLESEPELINESPYEKGWIFKIEDINSDELALLLDAKNYEEYLKSN